MKTRTLGQQGLAVSALGLSTMGMTMAYGPTADDEQSIATIRRAYELRVTFFDTAELYGMGCGTNEQLLGRAVKEFRDDVVLATKFGFDLSGMTELGVGLDSRPAPSARLSRTASGTCRPTTSTCSTSTASTLTCRSRRSLGPSRS